MPSVIGKRNILISGKQSSNVNTISLVPCLLKKNISKRQDNGNQRPNTTSVPQALKLCDKKYVSKHLYPT